MGYDPDTVPIVSFKGGGDQEQTNLDRRYSFLETLLGRREHAMVLLDDPLDGDEFKKPIVAQYEQVRGGINSEIVMLYDPMRLKVTTTSLQWPFGTELEFPSLDPRQLVMTKVEVLAPSPSPATSHPLKEFMCLTWTCAVQKMLKAQREEWTQSLIQYSQRVAVTRGVLMAGDLNYPTDQLSAMIKSMNQRAVESLYKKATPALAEYGLDQPSQVDYQLKHSKSLVKMKLYNCNSAKQNVRSVKECFVASEVLELKNASFLDMETYASRQITMEARSEREVLNTRFREPTAKPKTSEMRLEREVLNTRFREPTAKPKTSETRSEHEVLNTRFREPTAKPKTSETRSEREVLNTRFLEPKVKPKTSQQLNTKTRTVTEMTACDNPPRSHNFCPIQAELYVPQRPPTHSGG